MSDIHYQIHSNSPDKPWIMLIHGLFGSMDNLTALRRQLTESYQILTVDLPDHGKSAHTTSISFNRYCELLFKLVESLGIQSINLIGHSLGGKVAMQFSLNHPNKVNHLVVLDIAPVAYAPRHNNVFKGLNNVKLGTIASRKEADTALSEYVTETSTRQFLLKSLYNENDSWQWRFNLALLEQDYPNISAAITSSQAFGGKTLFIKGEHSDYLLPEHKSAVMELFPNSKSKMISGTGHWLHAEKPELCSKLIRAFLAK
ncbi:alpha/beta fold hydrolase [uncultured Paraglaciecola sp.]|uniref:alpha/beta fold hydrolase n=1 Tax=uncultured Paraglaciecola sp. TaxID=1765024 RepID=UPI00261758CA|nr:alpha/beta fold hydrolase [uncultured Paraglaciecola sp.]